MRRTSALIILAFSFAVASCGGADSESGAEPSPTQSSIAPAVTSTTVSPVLSEPVPLLVIAKTGGCFMMGPNCSTTLIMSDGAFGVFRTDPADVLAVPEGIAAADIVGQVDVTDLARIIADTDFAELRNELEPGSCRGCFDGIDVTVRFHTAAGPVDLSSVDYSFDPNLELFRYLAAIETVILASGDLEVVQRGA